MGTRTLTYGPCPQCKKEMEWRDAPTCSQYVGVCESCGWSDPNGYHEYLDGEQYCSFFGTEKEFDEFKERNTNFTYFDDDE